MAIKIEPFYAPVYNEEYIDLTKKDFSNKIALIDADRYKHLVVYRMYKKLMDEGHDHNTILLNSVIDEYLQNDIFSKFDAKAYVFCFSAPSKQVFRNYIAQEKKYKGNRKERHDPYYYNNKYEDMSYVYEYIEQRFPTLIFSDLEADDILSMLQDPEQTFIFSHDKDLKQVPGFHYEMNSGTLRYTSEEEGIKLLLNQVLTGDTTDNFGGLAGFGAKALEKFNQEFNGANTEQLLNVVVKKYIDKFGVLKGMDSFVEMWCMASMKINRGDYFREKYMKAFILIEELLK